MEAGQVAWCHYRQLEKPTPPTLFATLYGFYIFRTLAITEVAPLPPRLLILSKEAAFTQALTLVLPEIAAS